MNSEPHNKGILEWLRLPDGRAALGFDAKTWAVYTRIAEQRATSPEEMIKSSVVASIPPPFAVDSNAFAWGRAEGRRVLVFNHDIWAAFKHIAKVREQSPEHIIVRAVAECSGTILMDNYVLNRFLRR